MIAFPVVWFIVDMFFLPHPVHGLWTWNHNVLRSFQLSIYNVQIIQLQSALGDEYNNFFSGNIKPVPHFRANNWKTFAKKIFPGRSLRSSFIDPFSFAKKRCNTSQGFGAFFFQSCDRLFFLFFFFLVFSPRCFLIFMVTSDWVLNQLTFPFFKFQRKRNELRHLAEKYYFSNLIIVQLSFTTS